jgi:hypothetical protein
MRAHHAVAIVTVVLIGFGVKLFFFSAPVAEANTPAVASARMDILEMHRSHPNIQILQPQKLHDMTFVFSDGD